MFISSSKKMISLLMLTLVITQTNQAQAATRKLIDKIVIIFNQDIVTLSDLQSIRKNLPAISSIAPMIYPQKVDGYKNLADIIIQTRIIRLKLKELGVTIEDGQVEEHIQATEKNLGLSRLDLLNFLKENRISFKQYFEIIREALEFSAFNYRVLSPLVLITEQDLINEFFIRQKTRDTSTIKYDLVDFIIPEKAEKLSRAAIVSQIKEFQNTGVLSEELEGMDLIPLDGVTQEDVNQDLKSVLKDSQENQIYGPVKIQNMTHYFLVKKRSLIESTAFNRNKETLKAALYEKKAKETMALWIERAKIQQHIKILLK